MTRVCPACSTELPTDAHRERIYCDVKCKVTFNADKIRQINREGKARERASWTPERKAAALEYARQWRAANRVRIKANNQAAYRRDPAAAAATRDAWRLANPERHSELVILAQGRRRAAKRSGDARFVTRRELRRLRSRAAGCCFYCGDVAVLTLEHVVPLARGGRHAIGNLVMACDFCNKSKGSLLLVEWRARRAVASPVPRRVSDARLARAGLGDGESRSA